MICVEKKVDHFGAKKCFYCQDNGGVPVNGRSLPEETLPPPQDTYPRQRAFTL